ncbi:MAG: hypothetical protein WCR59_02810, partial [Planctomycetota bacterium]
MAPVVRPLGSGRRRVVLAATGSKPGLEFVIIIARGGRNVRIPFGLYRAPDPVRPYIGTRRGGSFGLCLVLEPLYRPAYHGGGFRPVDPRLVSGIFCCQPLAERILRVDLLHVINSANNLPPVRVRVFKR